MKLDLQKDAEMVYEYLKKRVKDFSNISNIGPGEASDPIIEIKLGYEYSQVGWVAVVFDTRPYEEYEYGDGEWNDYEYITENSMDMPHWTETLYDWEGSLEVIYHTGEKKILSEDEIGDEFLLEDMLLSVLERAKSEGLFKKLPLNSPCYMSLEHHDGEYAWPDYEDRDRLGIINP